MDPASSIDTLLDIFDSLGESLDTLAKDAGIDQRPAALKDKVNYQYHVELGAILGVVVIFCLLVSFCVVMKKKREKIVGISKKTSFHYVDFRGPAGIIVENV